VCIRIHALLHAFNLADFGSIEKIESIDKPVSSGYN
jgi:hypothetical protein